MADVALLGQVGRNVVGVVCTLKVFEVATHAGGAGQVVIVVGMALTALHIGMGAGERPSGSRVIEGCGSPIRSAVADFTLLGEAAGHVIRIVGALIVLEMAAYASRGADAVVAIGMTLAALHIGMGSGQGPPGGRVIEGGGSPIRSAVARLALLRKTSGHVIGILSCLEFCQMATHTSRGGQVVVAIRVTLRT